MNTKTCLTRFYNNMTDINALKDTVKKNHKSFFCSTDDLLCFCNVTKFCLYMELLLMLCGASSNLKLHSLAKIAVFGQNSDRRSCTEQGRTGWVGQHWCSSSGSAVGTGSTGVWGLATLSSPYPPKSSRLRAPSKTCKNHSATRPCKKCYVTKKHNSVLYICICKGLA